MKKKLTDYLVWLPFIFAFGIILLATIAFALMLYDDTIKNDYCSKKFPSPIKEISYFAHAWGSTGNIETGYIKCFRKYVNKSTHEIEIETKIIKYAR